MAEWGGKERAACIALTASHDRDVRGETLTRLERDVLEGRRASVPDLRGYETALAKMEQALRSSSRWKTGLCWCPLGPLVCPSSVTRQARLCMSNRAVLAKYRLPVEGSDG